MYENNDVDEKRVDYVYNDEGQLDSLTRYADLAGEAFVARTKMEYDERGQVTDMTHQTIDEVIADYDLTWDAAGRITDFDFTSTSGNDSADYEYDAAGQITDADYTVRDDEDYDYDDNGNRTNTDYSTGDHNRITSDGVYSYEYDNEGNITQKKLADNSSVEYEWDHRNRLTKVTNKDAYGTPTQIVEYAYDFGNRLVRRVLDQDGDGMAISSSIFVHDDGQIALYFGGSSETLDGTDLAHRNLWGPDVDQLVANEVLSQEDSTRWTLTDHLGSVRDRILSDGTLIMHATYDSFGNATITGSPALFLYTGRFYDAYTGLQNNLNRWYDANIGRWMSVDPVGFGGKDVNLYRYVGNSPLIAVDPLGLWKELGKNIWQSDESGDTFQALVKIIDPEGHLSPYKNDVLIKPIVPENDAELLGEMKKQWEKRKPALCGSYDVSRLLQKSETKLIVSIGKDDNGYIQAVDRFFGNKNHFDTGSALAKFLRQQSDNGRKPIGELIIMVLHGI